MSQCECGAIENLVVTNDDRVMCRPCWEEAMEPDPNPDEYNLMIMAVL